MKYIYRTSDSPEGDIVITSGWGENTPRGVVVGRVSQIGEDDGSLFKDVIVEPSCDFFSIGQGFCN